MCINTAFDSISHGRYRALNCVGISVAPGNISIGPPPHITCIPCPLCPCTAPYIQWCIMFVCVSLWNSGWQQLLKYLCVCVNNCVSVLRERKEAMSHSAHTTRTQQLPLLLGQGNPQRCGCIVWKNRADRDIIGHLSPTAVSGEGRGGGERRGEGAGLAAGGRQWFCVLGNLFSFFSSFLYTCAKNRLLLERVLVKAETVTHAPVEVILE